MDILLVGVPLNFDGYLIPKQKVTEHIAKIKIHFHTVITYFVHEFAMTVWKATDQPVNTVTTGKTTFWICLFCEPL